MRPARRAPCAPRSRPAREARVAWIFTGIVTGVLLAAIGGGYLWLVSDPFELTVARTGAPVVRAQPLPVPSAIEIRLTRARRLYTEGKLHAALALLEAGPVDERHAARVNELRREIQRQLIAAGRARAGFAPLETADAPPPPAPDAGRTR